MSRPEILTVFRGPIPEDEEREPCYVFLTAPAGFEFTYCLLSELLALAEPVGMGHMEALARRQERLASVVSEGVKDAARPLGYFNFDYVAGNRIKVHYYSEGIPGEYIDEDSPAYHHDFRGYPAIEGDEFEKMYGKGSLEGAVRLALDAAYPQSK